MEIASGAESVFMSRGQSTYRPAWPSSQAQVWSRHPQSSRLAVTFDYDHHITHYWKKEKKIRLKHTTKNMGKGPVYV